MIIMWVGLESIMMSEINRKIWTETKRPKATEPKNWSTVLSFHDRKMAA